MEPQKHSGIGIASFVVSLVSGFFMFVLIMVAGILAASTPGGVDEKSPIAVGVGLFLLAFLGLSLVAFGLGVGGILQKDKKKIFAILGMVFSAGTFLGTIFLMLLGLASK